MNRQSLPPVGFRFNAQDHLDLDRFAREWGPVQPLTRIQVVRELIRREKARGKRIQKKSGVPC